MEAKLSSAVRLPVANAEENAEGSPSQIRGFKRWKKVLCSEREEASKASSYSYSNLDAESNIIMKSAASKSELH